MPCNQEEVLGASRDNRDGRMQPREIDLGKQEGKEKLVRLEKVGKDGQLKFKRKAW